MSDITIYHNDCLSMLKEIDSNSIDLLVTDPPYRIIHHGTSCGGGMFQSPHASSGKLFEHNDIKFSEWLPDVYRVLKPATHAYIMINALNLKELQQAAEDVGFRFQNLLVWNKGNATPNKYYMQQCEFILLLRKGAARNINDMGIPNLINIPNEVGRKQHPTQKPIALMKLFIEQSSNEGDIILDPFVGVGATAIAAKQASRKFIGSEIDEQYYNIAIERLTNTTINAKQLTLL